MINSNGGGSHFEFYFSLITRLFCTYLHEIWHVYYVEGPTYKNAKILNKNKIQNGGGRHLVFFAQTAITQPPTFISGY